MNTIRVLALISVAWFAHAAAQSTVEHFPGGHIRIDTLIENTRAHLAEHPDDADAAINLGQLHNRVYAYGWDYLSPASTREVAERVIVDGLGMPPVHASNAVLPVSASRIKHLAEAIVLLQRGLALAPDNETGQLALGYAYMEAAKRYGSGDVIRDRVAVDEAAIEEVGERAYWESLALDILRVARATEAQPEQDASDEQNPTGYYIFQILAGRDSLTDLEREELNGLKKQALSFAERMSRLVSINGRPESSHDGSVSDAALAEVLAIYPFVPVNENAAEYYLRAMEAKAAFEDYDVEESLPLVGEMELTLPAEPLSEGSLQEVRAYLAYNAESLRLIHGGGKFSRCRYPIDLRLTHAVLLSHLSHMRHLTKTKALEAVYAAETGNGNGAVESMLDAIALSSALRLEPLLVPQLVRIACSDITVRAAEQVLNRVSLEDGNLLKLQSAFASLENEEDMLAGLTGERWMWTIPISPITQEDARDSVIWEKAEIAWRLKYPHLAKATCLSGAPMPDATGIEATDEEVKAMEKKLRVEHTESVTQELANCDSFLSLAQLSNTEMYRAVEVLQDARLDQPRRAEDTFSKGRLGALVAQVRLAARVRVVQTALAIERFRLRNGDIPEDLEALTPDYLAADVLEDPFTGESLLYAIDDDHYVVYSVAEPKINDRYVEKGGTAPSAISFSMYF